MGDLPMSENKPVPGYETTFITRSEISEETLNTLKERSAGAVPSFKGEVVLTEDWGRRKLAYPIENETRGRYTYMVYTGTGEVVQEIERNLRLSEHVLRFLSVQVSPEFDLAKFNQYREDLKAAARRRQEEREARREERFERGDRYDRGDRGDRYDRGDRGDRMSAEGAE